VTEGPRFVIDASAFLAYIHDEPGADEVERLIGDGVVISTANLAETLSKLAAVGERPTEVVQRLEEHLGALLHVAPLTLADAVKIAELMPRQRELDLSLGDRACLALGIRLGLPVLTADRRWAELDDPEIHAIR
jgi:PIN domain nuclease of toxin-antitoxin system